MTSSPVDFQVVNLGRRGVVNVDRHTLVSLNRRLQLRTIPSLQLCDGSQRMGIGVSTTYYVRFFSRMNLCGIFCKGYGRNQFPALLERL